MALGGVCDSLGPVAVCVLAAPVPGAGLLHWPWATAALSLSLPVLAPLLVRSGVTLRVLCQGFYTSHTNILFLFCIEILFRVKVNLRLHWGREAHTHKNPVPSGRHP